MTKSTTSLIGIILTIALGIFAYMNLCSSCGVVVAEEPEKQEAIVPATPNPTSYPFAFSDSDYACEVNDNFNFNMSSSSIIMPLASTVTECIGGLKNFLANSTGKVINITGYYKSDETNDSAYPNLGLARANAVKNHLVENGISSKSINTYSKLMNDMVPQGNVFLGPVSYSLAGESAETADELKALYEKIKADPLVLYFETNESSIALTPEQRQKVADISRYLDKVEGATCSVVGHTDNVGQRASNIILGQNRADFGKAYLIKNGITASKTASTSKGPDVPVESNTTEAGRTKNRRTVVTLN